MTENKRDWLTTIKSFDVALIMILLTLQCLLGFAIAGMLMEPDPGPKDEEIMDAGIVEDENS